jgi:DNA-binding transcriptional regulator YiaG
MDLKLATSVKATRRRLAGADLSDVFGIDMEEPVTPAPKNTKTFTPTAAAVTRLRKKLGMNISQFATLVGVSPPTVTNWENGSGKLNLRQRSLDALSAVSEYTPAQAARKAGHNDER